MPTPRQKRGRSPSPSANEEQLERDNSPAGRDVWDGWVEIESEPAFFNTMLNDMGVTGVRVQEVYGVDDAMLAFLSRPVHALIFLFRYCEEDEPDDGELQCPDHVWFAHQTPDFACATFALLNIANNIPGLSMGPELSAFQRLTANMNPLSRGDAIDNFDFVKQIHNSFGSESELLQVDMFVKNKVGRLKRQRASEKARESKAAKLQDSHSETPKSTGNGSRKSTRARIVTTRAASLSEGDEDFKARGNQDIPTDTPRRSLRTPKQRATSRSYLDDEDNHANAGFHFIAYMPIDGHVWKLDGLDHAPTDLGPFDLEMQDWLSIVQPALRHRMERLEGAEIEFNLMAVVHDTTEDDHAALCQHEKALQVVKVRLEALHPGTDGADDPPLSNGIAKLESHETDVAATHLSASMQQLLDRAHDATQLYQLQEDLLASQRRIRAAIRDRTELNESERERARHQRHDYGIFVRKWLRALADMELLSGLIDSA